MTQLTGTLDRLGAAFQAARLDPRLFEITITTKNADAYARFQITLARELCQISSTTGEFASVDKFTVHGLSCEVVLDADLPGQRIVGGDD